MEGAAALPVAPAPTRYGQSPPARHQAHPNTPRTCRRRPYPRQPHTRRPAAPSSALHTSACSRRRTRRQNPHALPGDVLRGSRSLPDLPKAHQPRVTGQTQFRRARTVRHAQLMPSSRRPASCSAVELVPSGTGVGEPYTEPNRYQLPLAVACDLNDRSARHRPVALPFHPLREGGQAPLEHRLSLVRALRCTRGRRGGRKPTRSAVQPAQAAPQARPPEQIAGREGGDRGDDLAIMTTASRLRTVAPSASATASQPCCADPRSTLPASVPAPSGARRCCRSRHRRRCMQRRRRPPRQRGLPR